MESDHHQALRTAGDALGSAGWFSGMPPQLEDRFSPYHGKGDKTELTQENQYTQGRFILFANTWEVVWRNKVSNLQTGRKSMGFFFSPSHKQDDSCKEN